MKRLFLSLLLLALPVLAQDISGKWAGEIKRTGKKANEGPIAISFEFKVAGNVLGGTGEEAKGKKPDKLKVVEGKITGQTIAFKSSHKTDNGAELVEWTGTVTGNVITLTSGKKKNPQHMTLKKQ